MEYSRNIIEKNDNSELVVVADVFPHPSSAFSYAENIAILRNLPSSSVITTGSYISDLGQESVGELIAHFKQKHPNLSDRLHNYNEENIFSTKLLYCVFLNTVYGFVLPIATEFKIPFVFTLYPGGGFYLNDAKSDEMLKKVFRSPHFKKVIVTQAITKNYLLEKGFCREEDIEYIFGVVTPQHVLAQNTTCKEHYGFDKETLDICFVSFKYTEFGEDKGYPIFIQVAKNLSEQYDNVHFHVVGPWNENVVNIEGINNIKFYGTQPQEWFENFYQDKDIVLSPNIDGKLHKGSFDGFPTACLTEAALRKVAMFGTDSLNSNNGTFEDKKDFIFIKHSVDDIVSKISYYYKNPDKLKGICENGQKKVRDVYSFDKQLKPRIDLMNSTLQNLRYRKMKLPFLRSSILFDKGNGFNGVDALTESIPIRHSGKFHAKFTMHEATEIVGLRFDPDEGHFWDISIESVLIDGKECQAIAQNAMSKSDEYDSFLTLDPIYHISAPSHIRDIEIFGKMRTLSEYFIHDVISNLQLNNDDLQQRNGDLQQSNNALTQQIADICSSTTWKLGYKLNRIFRFFISPKKNN